MRCAAENLALQVESCFDARFCLKSGGKWLSRDRGTGLRERGSTPGKGQTWAGTAVPVVPAVSKPVAAKQCFSPQTTFLQSDKC